VAVSAEARAEVGTGDVGGSTSARSVRASSGGRRPRCGCERRRWSWERTASRTRAAPPEAAPGTNALAGVRGGWNRGATLRDLARRTGWMPVR